MTDRPRFSIIIPNLNGWQHLPVCLTALRRQTCADFEVILVDNASTDGSGSKVREQFPEVRLLALDRNYGFTGACNAGWEASRGEIIVLLNNDTEADPGWLAAIDDALRRHPQAGSVASKMLLFDQRDHLHTAGDYYRVDGIPGNRGVWQKDVGQYEKEEYVFSACGGAAAYRRELIEEIGFLDDAYFFSCEDVDLGWRAQLVDRPALYVPAAIVYHKLQATGAGVVNSYHDGRNFLYLIWKNYPGSLLRRHWWLIIKAQLRISGAALRAWRGAAARARLRGQLAGLLALPRLWRRRRAVQATRRVADDILMGRLSPVDDRNGQG